MLLIPGFLPKCLDKKDSNLQEKKYRAYMQNINGGQKISMKNNNNNNNNNNNK